MKGAKHHISGALTFIRYEFGANAALRTQMERAIVKIAKSSASVKASLTIYEGGLVRYRNRLHIGPHCRTGQ